jgi:hypothetical protein
VSTKEVELPMRTFIKEFMRVLNKTLYGSLFPGWNLERAASSHTGWILLVFPQQM